MEINLSYEQLNAEYSMLMSVLGASVSKHLVDDHLPVSGQMITTMS